MILNLSLIIKQQTGIHLQSCQTIKSRWYTFPLGAVHREMIQQHIIVKSIIYHHNQKTYLAISFFFFIHFEMFRQIIRFHLLKLMTNHYLCINLLITAVFYNLYQLFAHCAPWALHSLFSEYFCMHVRLQILQVNNTHLDKTRSL